MRNEIEIAEREELGARFARRLEREAANPSGDRFVLALSGGSAAEAILPHLVAAELDWSRVDVVFIDDRAVPPDHPDSNYALARRTMLDRLTVRDRTPLDPARVHRLRGELADLDQAAREAETELRALLGARPRIDLAFLGVGPDGHVASLFPGHPELEETSRWVVGIEDSPKPPPRRLTMTLPLLAAVDLAVLVAFGAEKAAVVAEAVEVPESSLPLARALRLARRRILLLDREAASLLTREP